MPYAQFIHGKIRGGRSYQLVAFSADLAGRQAELEALARQYRFWGAHPPTENPVAVGLFRHEGGFLLAQAMRATLPDGRPAADAQGRAFTQHRYVFVPAPALKALSGRLWLLLNWFVSAVPTIPVLSAIDPALPPLPEPNPAPAWSDRAAVAKLARVINLRPSQGRPVVLDALAALTNGRRVVLDAAAGPGVASEDVLESLLMLLPAACRMQVSLAAGALDERVCAQADVLLKTNGPPEGQLPADLLWLRRAGNRFFGAYSTETFSGPYPALLEPIVARPESLPILLRILDDQTAAPENGRPPADRWHALRNGWMTARLMPAMPDPAVRARYWRDALAGLSPDGWRAIIPNIPDETGLEIAWSQLQTRVRHQPETYAPLVFLLWQNVSAEYVAHALSVELPADPDLAETLLRHGLLAEISPAQYPAARKMAAAVVANRAAVQPARAAELVGTLFAAPCFAGLDDRLALLDALLSVQPNRQNLADFVTAWLLPLLPDMPAAALSESRWLQHLGRGNWLGGRLLETLAGQWLADETAIDPHLLAGLLRPELTVKYAAADWLALAQICWLPDYLSLWPSMGQPVLTGRWRGQAVSIAQTCAARYTEPAHAHKLLAACRNWGLRREELAALVAEFPPQLCNFGLLHTYLYSDGAVIEPVEPVSSKLIALALQLSPTDPIEQAQLKTFLSRLLKRTLPEPEQADVLIAWGQSAVNQTIWRGALTGAVTELAAHHFSALLWQATRLQSLGEKSLSRMIVQSLDEFWRKQKAQFD